MKDKKLNNDKITAIAEVSGRINRRAAMIAQAHEGEHLSVSFLEDMIDLGDISERTQIETQTTAVVIKVLEAKQITDKELLASLRK